MALRALVVVLGCLAVVGCETIEDRIGRHQAFFDTLDPVTRTVLRAGEVRLGYTPTMAYIAFGTPDQTRRRTTAEGEALEWLYRHYYPVYDGTYFVGYRIYEVHRHGARRFIHVPDYQPFYTYEAEEYLRLTFRGGRITEIVRTE